MSRIGATIVCVSLVAVAMSALLSPVSAGQLSYVEVGKDYNVNTGSKLEMYLGLNASDNMTLNWKSGNKGDTSNFWAVQINYCDPALEWSDNWSWVDNMAPDVFFDSFDRAPAQALYLKASSYCTVGIKVWTSGTITQQVFNVTIERASVPGDLEGRVALLETEMALLNQTVGALNSTVASLEASVSYLSDKVATLEQSVSNHTHPEIEALYKQLAYLEMLYISLADNISEMQDIMGHLNITGDNVTVVYQNITRLYSNITNLTNVTTQNVTRTIMMYNNLTKTINAYDNKTLATIAKNITQTSVEMSKLVESVNATNVTARDLVSGLANTTAKKSDVKQVESDSRSVAGAAGAGMILLVVGFGALHAQNRSRINQHEDMLWTIKKPGEVPKAAAKKVDKK